MTDLEQALEDLRKEIGLQRPLSGMGIPFSLRYKEVLEHVKNKICPKAESLSKSLGSRPFEMGVLLLDAVMSLVTQTPFIATALSRAIMQYGIERFCADPLGIEEVNARDDHEMAIDHCLEKLKRDLGRQVNVDAQPYSCPSVKKSVPVLYQILASVIAASKNQHYLPKGIASLMPHVSMQNYYPNAYAHEIGTHAFIGFNVGVYYAIVDACTSISHHDDFGTQHLGSDFQYRDFHSIEHGGPRDRTTAYKDYSWLCGAEPSRFGHWRPLVASSTPTPRSAFGDLLTQMCLEWLAAHELAHVLLGHIAWFPAPNHALYEISPTLCPVLNLEDREEIDHFFIRYFSELEADYFASSFVLSDPERIKRLLATYLRAAKMQTNYDGDWPTDLDNLSAFVIYLVPAILHCIFAAAGNVSSNEWTSDHPGALARRSWMREATKKSNPSLVEYIDGLSRRNRWEDDVKVILSIFPGGDAAAGGDDVHRSINMLLTMAVHERGWATFGHMNDRLRLKVMTR